MYLLYLCWYLCGQVKVLMFDIIPGLSKHIKEMKLGMEPSHGKADTHLLLIHCTSQARMPLSYQINRI
jgi:hypothetical protein